MGSAVDLELLCLCVQHVRAEELDLLYMLFCEPGGASVMRRRGFPLQLQVLRGKQEEKQKY